MVEGKTSQGFKYSVDPEAVSDMEFIEDMAAIMNGETQAYPGALKKLLGEAGKKALYDFVRNDKGRVPIEAVGDIVSEIFDAIGEANATKNS